MPPPSPRPTPHDAREQGRSMLRWSLLGLLASVVAGTAWIGWKAATNPDVRLKPQWLPEGQAFDHSFWNPLLATVLVGGGIVGWILWRAYRRITAGEDLYEGRMGRGVRRRGERAVGAPDEA
ncbi:MAG TPA: hypothetical protein EYQ24_15740 [Bacteroidetes bacterium]|nr:hypothetical protein [Bacteroidota bacterium]HIL57806.1 hypothetical protein [Rhodothermales bacterium]